MKKKKKKKKKKRNIIDSFAAWNENVTAKRMLFERATIFFFFLDMWRTPL